MSAVQWLWGRAVLDEQACAAAGDRSAHGQTGAHQPGPGSTEGVGQTVGGRTASAAGSGDEEEQPRPEAT
jgi:hypothetical protein